MSSTVGTALDRALAQKDDGRFLHDLAHVDERFNSLDPERRPAPLPMLVALWILHQDVTMEGVWKFLAQSEGDEFLPTLRWCEEVGATRAVEYLKAVQRLFPRGKVPATSDKRTDVLERLEAKADATGDPEPLVALDRKYADAMPQLAQRVREWVKANRAAIERQLAEASPPDAARTAKPTRAKAPRPNAALAALLKEEAEAEPHAVKVARLKAAATRAGVLPIRGRRDEELFARFIESMSKVTPKQWTTVAQRYHKSEKKVQDAIMRAFTLSQQLRSGQLGDKSAFGNKYKRMMDASAALRALGEGLPKQVIIGGKKVGVAVGAGRAIAGAAAVARLHDWFMLLPADVALARHAYAPFEGIAWTPPVEPFPE